MRRLLLPMLALALLAACTDEYDGPDEGRVVAHEFDDADEWTTQSCTTATKVFSCTTQYHSDPEHWFLKVDDGDKHGRIEVSPGTFDRVKDGQWVRVDRKAHTVEEVPR